MRPILVTVLLALALPAAAAGGGLGLLLSWQLAHGGPLPIAAGAAVAALALALIAAPLYAWQVVPSTRPRRRVLLALVGLLCGPLGARVALAWLDWH